MKIIFKIINKKIKYVLFITDHFVNSLMICRKQVDPTINDNYSQMMVHAHGFVNIIDSAKQVILYNK